MQNVLRKVCGKFLKMLVCVSQLEINACSLQFQQLLFFPFVQHSNLYVCMLKADGLQQLTCREPRIF